jgi:hypothetical protein
MLEPVVPHAAAIQMGDRLVIQRWDEGGPDWPEPGLALAELPWAEVRTAMRRGPRGLG